MAIIKGYQDRIKAGETLGKIARTESDCRSAGKNGDLGFFGKGAMQKEFEDAAFALQPGELSGIVETASGLHLIERYATITTPLLAVFFTKPRATAFFATSLICPQRKTWLKITPLGNKEQERLGRCPWNVSCLAKMKYLQFSMLRISDATPIPWPILSLSLSLSVTTPTLPDISRRCNMVSYPPTDQTRCLLMLVQSPSGLL